MIHNIVLQHMIEQEKQGLYYLGDSSDQKMLNEMLAMINKDKDLNLQYLVELDAFHVKGAGEIVAKYITRFSSELIRACLLSQIVLDKVKDGDKIILELYNHFKRSKEYILPSSTYVYVRYDNAFSKLRSKRIKEELLKLVKNPRDVYYLPLTTKMLASWKIPELKSILLEYASLESVVARSYGYWMNLDDLEFTNKQLVFTVIAALKYYPEEDVIKVLKEFSQHSNPDVRQASKKVLSGLI